jgi:hypothetical protein
MNRINEREDHSGKVVDLPSVVLTPDDQEVDVSGDVWQLKIRSESTAIMRLDVSSTLNSLSGHTSRSRKLIRLYLSERLRSVKANTVSGDLEAFRRFLEWWSESKARTLKWNKISASDWRAFLDYCIKSTSRRGGIFSAIRSFCKWGAFQKDFSDFDKDIASSISQIRAPGNKKGPMGIVK